MDSLEEIQVRSIQVYIDQLREDLPFLRNMIAGTYDENLAEIRGRLAPIVHTLSLAAAEIRRLRVQYGGFREH